MILSVKNLSKSYKNYSSNLRRVLSYFGLGKAASQEIKIIKNMSFEVPKGQSIGLIGQNGAGKSTLLKMITGTLSPSSGTITVNGKICAILELGMGFIPDLSGRENAYQTASLFGHSKAEIDEKIAYIKDFAEIGEYFDQPVRLYSSGMQVRLAFAVSTAWRPDILIIDEALSVGDAYFQNKSFARIQQMKEKGTTLLLVSHDLSAIVAVCERAILIEKGEILKDGQPGAVLDYYNALISQKEGVKISQSVDENGVVKTISGNGKAELVSAYILNSKGNKSTKLLSGEKVRFCFSFRANEDLDDLVFGFLIKNRLAIEIYGTNTYLQKFPLNLKKGEQKSLCFELDLNIGVGVYSISTALHSGNFHLENNYEWHDNATIFEVLDEIADFKGLAKLNPKIILE